MAVVVAVMVIDDTSVSVLIVVAVVVSVIVVDITSVSVLILVTVVGVGVDVLPNL